MTKIQRFWIQNKNLIGNCREIPPHMDGVTGHGDIPQQLPDKYSTL